MTWTAQRHHAAHALNGMESFFFCVSFLSSSDPCFAGFGLLPDSPALGLASPPALAPAIVPIGGASLSGIGDGGDAVGYMSSVFDPRLGSVRGGEGVTLMGSVDSAL